MSLKKRLIILLSSALLLTACGGKGPQEKDFYSMTRDDNGGIMWLGMTLEEQRAATGWQGNNKEVRLKFRDNLLVSMTSVVTYFHPLGVTYDMAPADLSAYFAKDPAVTVTQGPNLLTAAKIIDGTQYFMRFVIYDDGTIKEITQAVDLTLDPPQYP